MSNPILFVQNAGFGTTPDCPEAKFAVGTVVRVRRLKHLVSLPALAAVAVVVPAGFPAEYALADRRREPRPLMITEPKAGVSYIVAFDSDPRPTLLRESDLLPSDQPSVAVEWSDQP